jgi:hypothetical protein
MVHTNSSRLLQCLALHALLLLSPAIAFGVAGPSTAKASKISMNAASATPAAGVFSFFQGNSAARDRTFTVAVTGASGLVGSALVQVRCIHFLAESVSALCNSSLFFMIAPLY